LGTNATVKERNMSKMTRRRKLVGSQLPVAWVQKSTKVLGMRIKSWNLITKGTRKSSLT
jgi:hypothetical protein